MSSSAGAASIIARALSGEYDWDRHSDSLDLAALRDEAIQHGVDALLWEALAEAGGAARALRDLLDPSVRAAAARDLFVQRDLLAVVDALCAADVPALITKGTALAYTVYAHPWLRPRTDTDLLVRHEDVAAAAQAFERCGYVRSDAVSTGELVSHQCAFERTDSHGVHHVIDLHWKIVNPQIVADALSFEELWSHARPAPLLGAAARVPSAHGSIALGCVHRLAHHQGQDRLVWLYDLKLLTATLTPSGWDALTGLACEHRIAAMCLDGLRAAHDRLGSTLPAAVAEALAAAAPNEPSKIYVDRPLSRRDVLLSDLSVLPRWQDRMRLVREHAFPPAAFIQQRYGTKARWLLPALYVHRLVTGASKWGRS
jgi:hypothetical protein